MIINDKIANQAAQHLVKNDPVLAPIIQTVGPATFRPHKNYYQELVDSIISQQLSVKAARSIEKRFCELFGSEDFPAPEKILEKDHDELRSVGLSNAKARYVKDLAQHVVDGRIKFDHLDSLSNEEVITELTAVKGIGIWTVHMFLMFCMGRSDVLPYGDLGIKNGIVKLYNLKSLPDQKKIESLAKKNKWHPFESIASWYIWQSLDNVPSI